MTPEMEKYIRQSLENLARIRDGIDPDWVEAHINLIDALRVMIRVDTRIGKELLSEEGGITREEYDVGMAEVAKMQEWLDKLESHEIDPTLHGMVK
jgi:hypothetical protein